ncbi:MAG: arginyltransferase [Gammaproteobacteria bacterium]|nr:arginyltransferase [Gammaproteobacteria bacterium]
MEVREIIFYRTQPHDCGYIDKQKATNVVLDPAFEPSAKLYSQLVESGFRRSGNYVYRPDCAQCYACISLRLPVADVRFNRSQRRIIKRNADIDVNRLQVSYYPEHFALYRRYLSARHPGGPMEQHSKTEYMGFLRSKKIDTGLFEFKLGTQLLAVAVVDYLEDSLSAVYTFYDPDYAERSLGIYAILQQIEEARRLRRKWLYLGYWIHDSDKMRYKTDFMPTEAYLIDNWQRFETAQELPLRYNGKLTSEPS